jgi:hypothetical protein
VNSEELRRVCFGVPDLEAKKSEDKRELEVASRLMGVSAIH